MAEKDESPKPKPQPQLVDRPKFPENRPIQGENPGTDLKAEK